jgi:hypothetical protein
MGVVAEEACWRACQGVSVSGRVGKAGAVGITCEQQAKTTYVTLLDLLGLGSERTRAAMNEQEAGTGTGTQTQARATERGAQNARTVGEGC